MIKISKETPYFGCSACAKCVDEYTEEYEIVGFVKGVVSLESQIYSMLSDKNAVSYPPLPKTKII